MIGSVLQTPSVMADRCDCCSRENLCRVTRFWKMIIPFPDLQRLSTRPIVYILYFPIVLNARRLLCAPPSSLTISRDSIIHPDPVESVKNTVSLVLVYILNINLVPINHLFCVSVLR